MKKISFIVLILAAFAVNSVNAQSLYGDFVKPPRDFKRGFYMGSDSGLIFFLKSYGVLESPGYNHGFFLGYDVFDFMSVEAKFRGIITNAMRESSLTGGMLAFAFNGLLRFNYPIKRIFPFIDIGGGYFFTRPTYPNGTKSTYNMEFGFGAEYYTFQRHFSMALRSAYIYINKLPDAMAVNLNFKYTF